MTRYLAFACILISTALLAGVYFSGGYSFHGFVLIFLMLVWCAGLFLHWRWMSILQLFLYYVFIAFGFFLDLSTGRLDGRPGLVAALLIGAALFVLLASDLADFAARLCLAAPEDDIAGLERQHFLRLLAVALAGGMLSAAALTMRVAYSFEWSVVLTIIVVWGIIRVINWFLQRNR
jgi:hypothetical protein